MRGLLLSVLIPSVLSLAYWFSIESAITSQQQRLAILKQETTYSLQNNNFVEAVPTLRQNLLSRIQVYQKLNSVQRHRAMQILGEISCLIPLGIKLASLDISKSKLILTGTAASSEVLDKATELLVRLDALESVLKNNRSPSGNQGLLDFNLVLSTHLANKI